MLRSVVVTDLTKMHGRRVCIAGYAVTRLSPDFCIRPEFTRGELTEAWLHAAGPVVRPFARIQLDLSHAEPDPPHTEDWIVRPEYVVLEPLVSEADRWALLNAVEDVSVAAIYGDSLSRGGFPHVPFGSGRRSLGTVFATAIRAVRFWFHAEKGNWRYRLHFVDGTGSDYALPVTDLAFRAYLDHLRLVDGLSAVDISARVHAKLGSASTVALRIGLARPQSTDHGQRCSLQVNGIYTEPDYLDGRCFTDFFVRTSPPAPPIDVPF